MTTLVFPSSVDASTQFLQYAKQFSLDVIGASSVENDPYKNLYSAWEKLPYINEENFLEKLLILLQHYNISNIFTFHAPTYLYLTEHASKFSNVKLYCDSPCTIQMQHVKSKYIDSAKIINKIKKFSSKQVLFTEDFLASLIDNVGSIYGECSIEKIIGLCAVFTDVPQGDVIEVGTFFGKSAYVLNRLAASLNIGPMIAIDSWDAEASIQHESPKTIQELSMAWDWEVVFKGFLLTMLGRHSKPFNYIRSTSVQAWSQYGNNKIVSSPEFGHTPLGGNISVLHLDGNHDEKAVEEDFKLWSQYLVPGGWIVFDDYEWSQGMGPRKVVDRIKSNWKHRIENYFVAGGAAFIKTKESSQ